MNFPEIPDVILTMNYDIAKIDANPTASILPGSIDLLSAAICSAEWEETLDNTPNKLALSFMEIQDPQYINVCYALKHDIINALELTVFDSNSDRYSSILFTGLSLQKIARSFDSFGEDEAASVREFTFHFEAVSESIIEESEAV